MSLSAPFTIDAPKPAGNIRVDRIDGDAAWLRPDLRDTAGDWFYWCCRVRGAQGRTLRIHFPAAHYLEARGPAVSLDEGLSWRWLGAQCISGGSFRYALKPEQASVWFSMGMPYTQRNWNGFLARVRPAPATRSGVLCRSGKGRDVEMLEIGQTAAPSAYRIVLTARHHACEMMASYALEGIIEAALADDDLGDWYRQSAAILALPFMDKDGVEDGDQGKNRRPHDHNRDYLGTSIYPEVAAVRAQVPQWLAGAPVGILLDLHCPWISGGINEVAYQPGTKNPENWRQQQRLGRLLQAVRRGPIPYNAGDDLPFGESWNVEANFAGGVNVVTWALSCPNVSLATVVELPYANAGGAEVNPSTARRFGHDLARALMRFAGELT